MPHVFGVYRKLPLLYEFLANTYIFAPQGQITNPNNTTVYPAISFNIGPANNPTYSGTLNNNVTGPNTGGSFAVYPGASSGFGQPHWSANGSWGPAGNLKGVVIGDFEIFVPI